MLDWLAAAADMALVKGEWTNIHVVTMMHFPVRVVAQSICFLVTPMAAFVRMHA